MRFLKELAMFITSLAKAFIAIIIYFGGIILGALLFLGIFKLSIYMLLHIESVIFGFFSLGCILVIVSIILYIIRIIFSKLKKWGSFNLTFLNILPPISSIFIIVIYNHIWSIIATTIWVIIEITTRSRVIIRIIIIIVIIYIILNKPCYCSGYICNYCIYYCIY